MGASVASVLTGIGSLSQVNVFCGVVVSDSDCEFVKPLTFSLSRKCNASVALESETKMHTEGHPVKVVPECIRRRLTPQSTLCKAVPACMQSRAPPPLAGTPWQIRPWPGPPQEPPAEEVAIDVEDSIPWTTREKVVPDRMGETSGTK